MRVNAVSTPYIVGDLLALAPLPGVSIIVVPKVSSAADLLFVSDVLRRAAPSRYEPNPESSPNPDPELAPSSSTPPPPEPGKPIKLLALIESARAVMDLASICQATPELEGLIFAAEDFALDLSLTRTAGLSEFLYARSAIVTAARAFELPSVIDLVCTSYRGGDGLERLREECRSGKGMGFNGKRKFGLFPVPPLTQPYPVKPALSLTCGGRMYSSYTGRNCSSPILARRRRGGMVGARRHCRR